MRRAEPQFCRSLPPERRGRLKNGNRAGDLLAAPRCGARTRCGGECRQPAMPNGRCRLHGGLSTGPHTPEGLARARRARLTHGGYSAHVRPCGPKPAPTPAASAP
ncbi:MAG: HGGxSTG domain-containing protein [Dongiaceae bacterium]